VLGDVYNNNPCTIEYDWEYYLGIRIPMVQIAINGNYLLRPDITFGEGRVLYEQKACQLVRAFCDLQDNL
jgi:hypothetical protein